MKLTLITMKPTLMLIYMELFLFPTAYLIQDRKLDLDQTRERDGMLFGFFQQSIINASNRNSHFSQKQTNLQSNPSKDETKNKYLDGCGTKVLLMAV
jgi:hypothetical protein